MEFIALPADDLFMPTEPPPEPASKALITLSPESLTLLAALTLCLIVGAFEFGRSAERAHRRWWGPGEDECRAVVGRPEPLPHIEMIRPLPERTTR